MANFLSGMVSGLLLAILLAVALMFIYVPFDVEETDDLGGEPSGGTQCTAR